MRVPYVRFWLNDFYDATDHLEFDVQNTYHAMLDKACMTGHGSLPNDESAIRLLLGISPKKWGKRRHLVMPFWTLGEDGRLHNKRLDLEWRKITDREFRDKVQPRERSPLGRPKGDQTEGKTPAITTRARAAASEAREDLCSLEQRDLPSEAQAASKPAASLRVRPHATPPAPNGSATSLGYTLNYPPGEEPPWVVPPSNGA